MAARETGSLVITPAAHLILVVDDDQAIRDLLVEFLGDEGFPTITGRHGAEGLALARERQPSLILMDLMMPVMNGIDAIAALRADPLTRWIGVIAMSAGVNLVQAVPELEADGVVSKPFDLDALVAEIILHLRRISPPPV